MELDANPCAAVLIVEFYDENVAERLAILQARQLGLRSKFSRTHGKWIWFGRCAKLVCRC